MRVLGAARARSTRTGLTFAAAAALLGGCGSTAPPPVTVQPPTVGPATAARCHKIAARLPHTVADSYDQRTTKPPSYLTAAWGKPAIVFRCGVAAPPRPLTGAQISVNGVRWLVTQGELVTWRTIGEGVTAEVDVPANYDDQDAILSDLSTAVLAGRVKATVSPHR